MLLGMHPIKGPEDSPWHLIFMRCILASAACFFVLTASAQPGPATVALQRLAAAEAGKTRFTNHKLNHTANIEPDGKVTFTTTDLYEETWINDLPYHRLLEHNGKPLTGRQLREEQKRYDDAVAGRQPLGARERILLDHARPTDLDANPTKALGPEYTLTEVRTEGGLKVFEATAQDSAADHCAWRYTLWISPMPEPFLVRYRADAPQPGSDACNGWQEGSFTLVDGVPKPAHVHSMIFVREGGDRITVEGDDTFSDYRRFMTRVTIGPATVRPPG